MDLIYVGVYVCLYFCVCVCVCLCVCVWCHQIQYDVRLHTEYCISSRPGSSGFK